jgi:hypothetical protein
MTKNKVVNTAKEHPARLLLEAMANPTGHIEAMEARGACELAESDILPAEGLTEFRITYQERWKGWHEKCGIEILGPVEGDEIFLKVKLPAGWKKELTDHSMWTDLLDERGRRRAGVFYKAAFYDRSAHIQPLSRFISRYNFVKEDGWGGPVYGYVEDGGKEIYRTPVFDPEPNPYQPGKLRAATEAASDSARAWLVEHYPDHEDPTAYWDEE